ncbi:glycoside hydrolase family 43 protein [Kitasatospora paranensis]|uniref:Glycoside hydrolase family 43 protein n=1 Tax=Kitasatospora paranensis TaxID=258053 RepID=A0ABW2FTJ5_9ACTN
MPEPATEPDTEPTVEAASSRASGTQWARNPVLPGFHPDPSVCRVGEDYYLVNSSFEYHPGLPLHHSRDLVHWRPIGHAVDRPGQLSLAGVRPSGGLYAPHLSHHDGVFRIVCTLVDGHGPDGTFLLTADDPAGPWSDPLWLPDAPGFDPSLFFDEDGSAHLLGTRQIHADGRTAIWLRAYDLTTGKPTGPEHVLFHGALVAARWAEGPHLYRHDGYYHLVLAEGGTEHDHAVTTARSRRLAGPYENNPRNPVLTHRHLGRDHPVTGAGHADLIRTPGGDWYALLLASRPYGGGPHANLGRETFLARVVWEDGWPVVNPGAGRLTEETEVALPPHPWPAADPVDHFDGPGLAPHWNVLRTPPTPVHSLTARPGHLRLPLLPQTLADHAAPAFVGRRQQHIDVTADTALDFAPAGPHEAAGLAVLYDAEHHVTLLVTGDGRPGGRVARVTVRDAGVQTVRGEAPLPPGPVRLSVRARGQEYTFGWAPVGAGPGEAAAVVAVATVDGRLLNSAHAGGFTGCYLGLYATARRDGGSGDGSHNGSGSGNHADFDWFGYHPEPGPGGAAG